MYIQNPSKVGFRHIVKHFWVSIKPQKWYFSVSVIGFSFAVGLQAALPIYYKKLFDLLAGVEKGGEIVTMIFTMLFIILFVTFPETNKCQ